MSEDTVYRQEASFSSGEWQQEAFQLAGVVRVATQECLILYKTLFKGYEKNGCVFPWFSISLRWEHNSSLSLLDGL